MLRAIDRSTNIKIAGCIHIWIPVWYIYTAYKAILLGDFFTCNGVVVIPIPWQFHIRFLQIEIQFPLQTAISKWHLLNSLILYYGFTVKSVFHQIWITGKIIFSNGFRSLSCDLILSNVMQQLMFSQMRACVKHILKRLLHAIILSPNLLAEFCLSLHYNCNTWQVYSTQSNCMLLDETLVQTIAPRAGHVMDDISTIYAI